MLIIIISKCVSFSKKKYIYIYYVSGSKYIIKTGRKNLLLFFNNQPDNNNTFATKFKLYCNMHLTIILLGNTSVITI